jgi:hypothetical protein
MKLQLGQTTRCGGYQQIVTAVNETHARIATRSAKEPLKKTVIKREQNDFFGNKLGTMAAITQPGNWPGDLLEFLSAIGDEGPAYSGEITENEMASADDFMFRTASVGEVVRFEEFQYAVVAVNDGFARLLRLDGKVELTTNPFSHEEVSLHGTSFDTILYASGDKREELTKPITQEEKMKVMATKTTQKFAKVPKNKNRGGLAAETVKPHDKSASVRLTPEQKKAAKAARDAERYAAKKARDTQPEKKTTKTKTNKPAVFGFSVNSLLVAAGGLSTTPEKLMAILEGHGIKLSMSKIKGTMAFGKKHGGGAVLLPEHITKLTE